jgi:hypothetical protein
MTRSMTFAKEFGQCLGSEHTSILLNDMFVIVLVLISGDLSVKSVIRIGTKRTSAGDSAAQEWQRNSEW